MPREERFATEEKVIVKANDTEFDLAPNFYTHDIGRVWPVAEALGYGIVGIDDYIDIKYILMSGLDK